MKGNNTICSLVLFFSFGNFYLVVFILEWQVYRLFLHILLNQSAPIDGYCLFTDGCGGKRVYLFYLV
jgi:hypothetical protein